MPFLIQIKGAIAPYCGCPFQHSRDQHRWSIWNGIRAHLSSLPALRIRAAGSPVVNPVRVARLLRDITLITCAIDDRYDGPGTAIYRAIAHP